MFAKTKKEAPKDEASVNARLLIRGGFIHKEMAGAYSYLPMGLRVLKKIEQIIREEIDAIGGQEIVMTALQEKAVWEKTGRWDDAVVDNWFKTKLKNESELGLAYTHEPAITALMKEYISSYRDLPVCAYQFQTKFRNELRARSGLFRGREFIMKDLYSFHHNQQELDAFYEKAIQAYRAIFARLGLGERTYLTMASGGSFGTKYSHEFQTLTAAGEDTIYLCREKQIAINDEIFNEETLGMLGIGRNDCVQQRAIEVGNIYKLGTFYSEPLGLRYTSDSGESRTVVMGSYGIGLGRVMGAIVEALSDDRGIVWPEEVAPFAVHLVSLAKSDIERARADEIYVRLSQSGIETLYDDRDSVSAGEKFADADLIGIPARAVVSERTLAEGAVEVKRRSSDKAELAPVERWIGHLTT